MTVSSPASIEHPFAAIVRILGKGKRGTRHLSYDEAYHAFEMVLSGEVTDVQLGAFLMLLRVKEESTDELAGFVMATRKHIQRRLHAAQIDPQTLGVALDWQSYAGKRKHHTWYVLAALALSQQGIKILIHGAAGHTANRLYTQDVFASLGLPQVQQLAQLPDLLRQHNLVYVSIEHLAPRLYDIVNLRHEFGLRSPVHTLLRLINPCQATASVQSIFHPAYQPKHWFTARQVGLTNTIIIKGDGGEFERRPDARTKVLGIRHNRLYQMNLPMLNRQRSDAETDLSIEKLVKVWQSDAPLSSEDNASYAIQAIIETMALSLLSLNRANSYHHALGMSRAYWQQRDKSVFDG